eukprot:CAMPEP_0178438298 /NCGR_PEP_ID=MMETSP0689_2-20121128/35515_1 /TAXON_ID=160604 /ORGANISM="Amphidinium massartii, Strain CS-259" /LENGTH=180 /DNA_ID=CAMNT_0020060685 /DNA_START=149 /DNA_END=688 /DNA_ORIENTATION=-
MQRIPAAEEVPLPKWVWMDMLVRQIDQEVGGAVPLAILNTMARSGLLQRVPRDENGALTSVGSSLHGTGRCIACAFWSSGRVCLHSVACTFCHFCNNQSEPERYRPSKQMRVRMQRWMQLQAAQTSENHIPHLRDEDLTPFFGTAYRALKEALAEVDESSGSSRKARMSGGPDMARNSTR